uniref:Uncharacterized protein n=1 Tax=Rhizophora mucronata TaxID=61149 RepID=A0A2P2Q011_RHIMU
MFVHNLHASCCLFT